MTRREVARLSLDAVEATVVDSALRYYADTFSSEDDDDEETAESIREDRESAVRIVARLRASLGRHGYRLRDPA